jgi:dimethylaniline monooxygenase (N-oxide forming)
MPEAHESSQSPDAVTVRIEAPPERIYAIVTDIAQMGRLSPECTGGKWLDGATGPAVGARFKGRNKRGLARWSTTNKVIEAEAPRVFSFETLQSGYAWTYLLESDGPSATFVTESRAPFRKRPLVAKVFTQVLLGGEDGHTDELRDGMRQTLERVKALAESG